MGDLLGRSLGSRRCYGFRTGFRDGGFWIGEMDKGVSNGDCFGVKVFAGILENFPHSGRGRDK